MQFVIDCRRFLGITLNEHEPVGKVLEQDTEQPENEHNRHN